MLLAFITEYEIVENGEDLGSEDSEEEGLDDDYDSQDSFIVPDSEDAQVQGSDDDEDEDIFDQITKPTSARRRRSRIIEESSTDDSNDSNMESSVDVSSNDVVAVSVQADSIVVLVGNNAAEEKIVEGKTFATTYLLPENDVKQSETRTEKPAEEASIHSNEPAEPKGIDQVTNESVIDGESTSAPEMGDEKAESDLIEKADTTAATETVTVPQDIPDSTSADEVKEDVPTSQKSDSDANATDGKEPTKQKISLKKQRASLPGINPLSKASSNIGKKASRMSLGALNPNQQHLRGEILGNKTLTKSKSVSSKVKLIEKEDNEPAVVPAVLIVEPEQNGTDERDSSMDASTSSIENVTPNRSKAAATLNNSSHEEENNNRKSSAKKCKYDENL